jgi:hypothetical protein
LVLTPVDEAGSQVFPSYAVDEAVYWEGSPLDVDAREVVVALLMNPICQVSDVLMAY